MTTNHQPHHDHLSALAGPPPARDGGQDFDARWWEQHYRDADPGAPGPPGAQLVAEVLGMTPGTVLDAGCGTGADAVWLARQGWDVTAVDVSPTAVQRARALVAQHEPEVTSRISLLVADLTIWRPPGQYNLVVSQYVHPDMPFGDFTAHLAQSVAPGGTLLVVGHDHADGHSATHAPKTASIGSDAVTSALDPAEWTVDVAETRTRRVSRDSTQITVADTVVRAHRTPST